MIFSVVGFALLAVCGAFPGGDVVFEDLPSVPARPPLGRPEKPLHQTGPIADDHSNGASSGKSEEKEPINVTIDVPGEPHPDHHAFTENPDISSEETHPPEVEEDHKIDSNEVDSQEPTDDSASQESQEATSPIPEEDPSGEDEDTSADQSPESNEHPDNGDIHVIPYKPLGFVRRLFGRAIGGNGHAVKPEMEETASPKPTGRPQKPRPTGRPGKPKPANPNTSQPPHPTPNGQTPHPHAPGHNGDHAGCNANTPSNVGPEPWGPNPQGVPPPYPYPYYPYPRPAPWWNAQYNNQFGWGWQGSPHPGSSEQRPDPDTETSASHEVSQPPLGY